MIPNRNIIIKPDIVTTDYLSNYKYFKKIMAERAAQKVKEAVYKGLDNHTMDFGDCLRVIHIIKLKKEAPWKKFY